MSGIHFNAMSAAIETPARGGKPLKTLLIILLVVWIAPSLLLFFYLAWKGKLFSRYAASFQSRLAEPRPNVPESN